MVSFFLLFLQAREQDLLMPVHKAEVQEDYAGGHVIEPKRGYRRKQVDCLNDQVLVLSVQGITTYRLQCWISLHCTHPLCKLTTYAIPHCYRNLLTENGTDCFPHDHLLPY